MTKRTRIHDASPGTLTTSVQATDVDTISQIAGPHWTGDTVVYAHRSGEVVRLPEGASLPVTLKVLEYELFHFCPVKVRAFDKYAISFADYYYFFCCLFLVFLTLMNLSCPN